MAHTQPGSYVLYREPGSNQPYWPGVVYPDDIAPHDIRNKRPSAYMTLVLLIGESHHFRWATTMQLSPFVPVSEADIPIHPEDLHRAYQMALNLRDSPWGLEDWRSIVDAEFNSSTPLDPDIYDASDDESESNEKEFQEAMRISRKDYERTMLENSLTMTSRADGDEDEDEDEDMQIDARPRARTNVQPPLDRTPLSPIAPDDDQNVPRPGQSSNNSYASPLDQLRNLGRRSAQRTTDNIECDLTESKEFVQVLVGPEHEIRTFPIEALFDRPYFRDQRAGINFFEMTKEGIYELRHPQLESTDVEDFQFVAEFLTSGSFGIQQADDEDMNEEAIAQCVCAWQTAEKLGVHDMLDYIAVKVQTFEWDDVSLLALASAVYRGSEHTILAHEDIKDARTELKEWISDTLAHRFWAILEDESINKKFKQRMKRIPGLEMHILSRRVQILERGAQMEEEDEDVQSGGE